MNVCVPYFSLFVFISFAVEAVVRAVMFLGIGCVTLTRVLMIVHACCCVIARGRLSSTLGLVPRLK